MNANDIRLVPMTDGLYRTYLKAYENDPDLYLPGQPYEHYVYSEERASRYIRRQKELHRTFLRIRSVPTPAVSTCWKRSASRSCARTRSSAITASTVRRGKLFS